MPVEMLTGETPDISEYLDFGFYDWVVFKKNAGLGEAKLGRWLCVSHKVGRATNVLLEFYLYLVFQSLVLLFKGSLTWSNKQKLGEVGCRSMIRKLPTF